MRDTSRLRKDQPVSKLLNVLFLVDYSEVGIIYCFLNLLFYVIGNRNMQQRQIGSIHTLRYTCTNVTQHALARIMFLNTEIQAFTS